MDFIVPNVILVMSNSELREAMDFLGLHKQGYLKHSSFSFNKCDRIGDFLMFTFPVLVNYLNNKHWFCININLYHNYVKNNTVAQ